MRITGGEFRSRRLVAPAGHATRPTSDRVREALFSILGSNDAVQGKIVLDLFAGTGALGLEALSRGAERATFVEKAPPALRALRSNLASLAVEERSTVLADDVDRALARLGVAPYGLVLLDPPYAFYEDAQAVGRLSGALVAICAPETLLIVEHGAKQEPHFADFQREDARQYGDSALAFFRPLACRV